jgi:hypothetical protein
MRQTISGLIAVVALVTASTVPALACGFGSCSPCGPGYAAPCATPHVYVSPECNTGCGVWAHARLPDPEQQYHSRPRVHQYYYVNQGPTFTGPGAFAPYPTYEDGAVSDCCAFHAAPRHYRYGAPTLRSYY